MGRGGCRCGATRCSVSEWRWYRYRPFGYGRCGDGTTQAPSFTTAVVRYSCWKGTGMKRLCLWSIRLYIYCDAKRGVPTGTARPHAAVKLYFCKRPVAVSPAAYYRTSRGFTLLLIKFKCTRLGRRKPSSREPCTVLWHRKRKVTISHASFSLMPTRHAPRPRLANSLLRGRRPVRGSTPCQVAYAQGTHQMA